MENDHYYQYTKKHTAMQMFFEPSKEYKISAIVLSTKLIVLSTFASNKKGALAKECFVMTNVSYLDKKQRAIHPTIHLAEMHTSNI